MFLLILVVQVARSPQVHATPDTSPRIDRLIYITDWGVTVVNDTVTIDTGSTSPTHLRIGIPGNLESSLRYSSAQDNAGALQVSKSSDTDRDVAWLDYTLRSQSGAYIFHATTVFSDRVKFTGVAFDFNFTQTPIMEQRVESCNVTVVLPKDAQISARYNVTFAKTQHEGGPALNAVFEPLDAMTRKDLIFGFTSISVQITRVSYASRKITFTSSGSLNVEDTYDMGNEAGMITSLNIRMPPGSTGIMAYDHIGPLWETSQTGGQVSISPRWGPFKSNESFRFTLRYKMPAHIFRQLEWWGKYDFSFQLLTPQPFIIDTLDVEIILPQGTKVDAINPSPDKVTETPYRILYSFSLSDATPFTDLTLEMRYRYIAFWAALEPFTWLIAVMVAIIVLAVALRRPVLVKEAAPPVDVLRTFTQLQDEKSVLRSELEKLEESLARKGMSKHEFRRRRRAIDYRLSAINREQRLLKGELLDKHPRIADLITKLDRAEAEIQAARLSIFNVRSQYRAGKISKETYMNMDADFTKRLERAKATLDSVNVSLKQELE